MIKAVLIIILSLLTIFGICETIHAFCMLFLTPKKPVKNYLLLYLSNDKAYSQLKFAIEQFHWYGNNYAERIVAITDDVDEYQLDICRSFLNNNSVIFCESSVLHSIIKEI